MNIVEKYSKEIAGKVVEFTVECTENTEYPYYVQSTLNVDGAGKTIVEAKEKCENATKMYIMMND